MPPTKFSTRCDHCGSFLDVASEYNGRNAKCPRCSKSFVIRPLDRPSSDSDPVGQDSEEIATSTLAKESAKVATSTGEGASPTIQPAVESVHGSLGRFALREVLGQGAFGRVYRAYDPQLDRELALKVPLFGEDEQKKAARFQAEAKASSRLRHPNIVPTFDSGRVGNQYYIATQYIEGETLSVTIKKQAIAPEQAARWAASIASALAYAHEMGVVHRDVKPQNIILDARNEPQLLDFGLAKRVNEDSGMTTEGSLLGTPAYMSPEQARGDTANVGPHSDQYAAGAVLYELLSGRRPFEGPPHAVLAQILTDDPPSPRSIRPDIPKDLEAIALKAMAKEPAKRYCSCTEMFDDLERWVRGEPTFARPESNFEKLRRWSRRNRTLAGSLMLVGTVILAAFLGISAALYYAEMARQRADRNLSEAERQTEIAKEQSKIATLEQERAQAAEKEAKRNQEELQKALDQVIAERKRADESNAVAQEQRGLAESQQRSAQDFAQQADRAREKAADQGYQQLLQLIFNSHKNEDYTDAKEAMADCLQVSTDTRGWESQFLYNLIQGPSNAIKLESTPDFNTNSIFYAFFNSAGTELIAICRNGTIASIDPDSGMPFRFTKTDRIQVVLDRWTSERRAMLLVLDASASVRVLTIDFDKEGDLKSTICASIAVPFTNRDNARIGTFDFDPIRQSGVGCIDGNWFTYRPPHLSQNMPSLVQVATRDLPSTFVEGEKLASRFGTWIRGSVPDRTSALSTDRSMLFGTSDGKVNIHGNFPNAVPKSFRAHLKPITALAMSRDGSFIATGSEDQTIRVWNASTLAEQFSIKAHSATILGLDFSPDNSRIVALGGGSFVHSLSDIPGSESKRNRRNIGPVQQAAWIDGQKDKLIAMVNNQGAISLHETIRNRKPRATTSRASLAKVALSSDGRFLAGMDKTKKSVIIYELSSSVQKMGEFPFPPLLEAEVGLANEKALSEWWNFDRPAFDLKNRSLWISGPLGSQIVLGHEGNLIQEKRWRDQGEWLFTRISIDGEWVANRAGILRQGTDPSDLSWKSSVTRSEWVDGQGIITTDGTAITLSENYAVLRRCLNPDSRTLKSKESITKLKGHTGKVTHVVATADSKRIVTGATDGTVRIWNAMTGTQLLTLFDGQEPIGGLDFSEGDEFLLIVTQSGAVQILDGRRSRPEGHEDRE